MIQKRWSHNLLSIHTNDPRHSIMIVLYTEEIWKWSILKWRMLHLMKLIVLSNEAILIFIWSWLYGDMNRHRTKWDFLSQEFTGLFISLLSLLFFINVWLRTTSNVYEFNGVLLDIQVRFVDQLQAVKFWALKWSLESRLAVIAARLEQKTWVKAKPFRS